MTIPVSVAFKAFIAQGAQTLCTIIRIARTDGTVLGFSDHDQDLVYDDGDGNVTYLAAVGYRPKDIANSADMTVGNTEYDGILNSPSITEADLQAGLWDYAGVRISYVNWADLTMGACRMPGWKLGQVTVKRNEFTAELRDIFQAYATTIGELTSPGCRANLGDARCKVDLTAFTVTGTLTGVSASQMVLYDTGRTEPGPSGGLAISGVSNANPCVITVTSTTTLSAGEPITLSGIVGPALLNASTFVFSVLSPTTFSIEVDTTNTSIYPPWTSGGTASPLGGSSGYFDFGIMTMTSGLANGFSQDILSYVPGQWTLQLPFPYAVAIGDTYKMVAGCDKSLSTCKNRFSNVANMRAEPYLPGIDKIVQVGKQ